MFYDAFSTGGRSLIHFGRIAQRHAEYVPSAPCLRSLGLRVVPADCRQPEARRGEFGQHLLALADNQEPLLSQQQPPSQYYQIRLEL